jgi:hypothetical protein
MVASVLVRARPLRACAVPTAPGRVRKSDGQPARAALTTTLVRMNGWLMSVAICCA